MSTLVEDAIAFATKAHEGQFRKGGAGIPYITHPLSVMNRLKRHGVVDEVTLAAAVLHDVVEDCGVSVATLIAMFGVDVGATVAEVSGPPGLSKNQAKKRQLKNAPTMSLRARVIKGADKTDNVEDIMVNPPGWSAESIIGYTRSAMAIVEALALPIPEMVAEFNAIAHRTIEDAHAKIAVVGS